MIVAFGSLATSTPYLGVILFIIVGTWIYAANSLSKEVDHLHNVSAWLPVIHNNQDFLDFSDVWQQAPYNHSVFVYLLFVSVLKSV